MRFIQVLLGHAKLDTTALDTQVATNVICAIMSPFGSLYAADPWLVRVVYKRNAAGLIVALQCSDRSRHGGTHRWSAGARRLQEPESSHETRNVSRQTSRPCQSPAPITRVKAAARCCELREAANIDGMGLGIRRRPHNGFDAIS
jgi:hypothetical protein